MSINPFEYNPNYIQLFRILSEPIRCDSREVVELYKKKDIKPGDSPYCLLRYTEVENQFPRKIIHKFRDLIATEVTDDCGKSNLFITTIYGDNNLLSHKFNACCGTKVYTLKVEQALYEVFFRS
jgi:hypothetical protein|uniref:Uncharacterized protein n=1 Tax=viral metagenome TaxID=1070528 RepID=A0A6C0HEK5_9ZZZZ